jgi:hypothetical protein
VDEKTISKEPQWAVALEAIVDALEWWGCHDALGAAGRVIGRLREEGLILSKIQPVTGTGAEFLRM